MTPWGSRMALTPPRPERVAVVIVVEGVRARGGGLAQLARIASHTPGRVCWGRASAAGMEGWK